ncbi:MAG: AAA family ATPase [Phycisphaeraceae bacterium]|nr:AAA family ATPase [Phycisphaeraceae bacterium]MCB9847032.1 AAA family ATPase [Phycisphaeraceae bacterium]
MTPIEIHHSDRGWGYTTFIFRKEQRPMKPIITELADVHAESVRWVWPGVLAAGKLTLLAGDPGLGKSFITLDLAARVTNGGPWPPDGSGPVGEPRGVVLLSAEDDPADTIRPRLDAAGADIARICLLDGLRLADGAYDEFDLQRHIAMLEEVLESKRDIGLVIIDPISAYTGHADTHNNASVRALLKPLSTLAQDYRCAVLTVTHLRKGGSGGALYRTMGSLAFTAAARSVWAVMKEKDRPTSRLFLPVKSNIGADSEGYRYTIEEGRVAWDPEPVPYDADEGMFGTKAPGAATAEQVEWLRSRLATGPVASGDVERSCKKSGYSWESIRKHAKVILGVRSVKRDKQWFWTLPPEESAGQLPLEPGSAGIKGDGKGGV